MRARALALLACASLDLLVACGGGSDATPKIDTVNPNPMCSNAASFTIEGSGFDSKATVTIDGMMATAHVVNAMMITVSVPSPITSGMHAVEVDNPNGKKATSSVTIEAQPLMFFVDPPVVWNGTTIKVTMFMSGLSTTINSATAQLHSDAMPNPNPVVMLTDVAPSTNDPNQIQATLPAGTPDGVYDVTVSDGTCSATLPNGLHVVASTDITLTAITPPFGSNMTSTAVEIDAATPVPPPYGFTPTPSVYISLHGSASAATALRAVSYISPTQITAVVPQTTPALPVGDYDVIVVDPPDANGAVHVGVIQGSPTTGFHVLASAPPQIDDATPQSLATAGPITITGSGFVTSGASQSQIRLDCELAGVASTIAIAPGSITYTSTSSLSFTLPTIPAAGTVCVIHLSNGDPANPADPYTDYSAIAWTTSSGNLNAWQCSAIAGNCVTPTTQVASLATARRGLQLVEGRVSSTTRYVYALGGDSGTKEGALASVEASRVNLYGDMTAFVPQVHSMVEKRTLFGAVRIANFIYAVGGYGGTSATAPLTTVERAEILDPLAVPQVPQLALTPAASGLAKGSFVYRVAAVMATTDPSNPGGETLPSDPLNVVIPDLSAVTPATPSVTVALSFPAVPGAASYNIYRTALPGQTAEQVKLLANVPAPATGPVTYTDTGMPSAGASPLPIGSLGMWHIVTPAISVGRVGGAVVTAHAGIDGANDVYWLYIAGGASTTPTPAAGTPTTWSSFPDSYEVAKVSIDTATKVQTVSSFTLGSTGIGGGRALAAAWAVDSHILSSVPAGTTYIYFGDGAATGTGLGSITETATPTFTVVGKTAANATTQRGVVASTTNGDLGTLATVNAEVGPAGAFLPVEGYLFVFGGMSTVLSTQSKSAAVSSSFGLGAWNANGTNDLPVGLALAGGAVESAFIYLAGGTQSSTGAVPTTTVLRTIW